MYRVNINDVPKVSEQKQVTYPDVRLDFAERLHPHDLIWSFINSHTESRYYLHFRKKRKI